MADLVRFGFFEFDLEAAELRSEGRSIRLPQQQFQILNLLLLAKGGVVSREDIRMRLWPNDTVVEFDRSINAGIMKLRIALGDTGDKPRYIETLVRRGYRLLVPVEQPGTPLPGPSESVNKPGSLIGQRVSHYRVLGILGGGGMGLVYKGEDLKLDRPVAMKFLPEEIAADPFTVQRFQHEARIASWLNHPNICTVYEVEEHDDQPFIVMELLEGETLRELIARFASADHEKPQGIPFPKILDIAIQIAEGLNAAHKKGIVHRDIKPANIFVTTEGRVKILDFGVAQVNAFDLDKKLAAAARSDLQKPSPHAPDATVDLTLSRFDDHKMGTAGYMSPEQICGEKLDSRTDLFSFGMILYEMVAGRRAFVGNTSVELQGAILHRTPTPLRQLNSTVPESLEALIARTLEKDRRARYAAAAEILSALINLKQRSGENNDQNSHVSGSGDLAVREAIRASSPSRSGTRSLGWLGAAIAIGILGFLIRPMISPPRVTGTKKRTQDSVRKTVSTSSNSPMLLTDGSTIYFVAFRAPSSDDFRTPYPQLLDVSTSVGEFIPMEIPLPLNGTIGAPPPQSLLIDGRTAAPCSSGEQASRN